MRRALVCNIMATLAVTFVALSVARSSIDNSTKEICKNPDGSVYDCKSGVSAAVLRSSEPASKAPKEVLMAEAASKAAKKGSMAPGLRYWFYNHTCSQAKSIIEQVVRQKVQENPLQAAGILRIMFHDCFVQGCDASILLSDGSHNERSAPPNLSLRIETIQMVDEIKGQLEAVCPLTVSCADIIIAAAVEAIAQTHGPTIDLPLGRRDSLIAASSDEIVARLPAPFMNVAQMAKLFSDMGFEFHDMVALSGAHTLGQAHCSSFSNRLFPVDPNMDTKFANELLQLCPANNNNHFHPLDSTPAVFDNAYFNELLAGSVLLSSDAALKLDSRTHGLVKEYANDANSFNEQFVRSFLKLSQFKVLTLGAGTIRRTCSSVN